MAYCLTDEIYGYESSRFEKDVDEIFHCSICCNVLKEPRTCRNNDHMFCLDCITEHLKVNSQTCPECNEHLSLDTLHLPRVVSKYLSELKINCDNASRGCPEFVRVADLKSHGENCGFAPVLCSNEECGMEINKQDKVHHETEVCEYRRVKCHECGQIQEVVGRLEGNLTELDEKVETIKEHQQEVKDEVNAVKEKVEVIKEAQQELKIEVQDLSAEAHDVKEYLSKVNKNVDEVKLMMIQVLEKLNKLQLLDKLPSPTERMINKPREDILIAGGSVLWQQSLKSTEIYSWEKNRWFEISEMSETHKGASSFIYKDQLFVVGGAFSNTIESLDLNELPLKWMRFPRELPSEFVYHQTVVCQDRIIHIGGYNDDESEWSNVISELQLSSPFTMKELCQMPEPRDCHGADVFEDKVLIMGGEKGVTDFLDSVLQFDVRKNECKEMPPLPHTLLNMATLRWRDKVVVLGGEDEDGHVLNDVFMYDCRTGKTTTLPFMLEKRSGLCAVITGNTIVVMGGCNNGGDTLSSVECFTMGGSTWKYLPAMNEARYKATANVLPSTRKYV